MAATLIERAWTMFRSEEPAPPARAPRKAVSAHHAVVVVPGRHACTEACALRNQRFLSREAPALPLPGCGSAQCECRYEHHDDRRKGLRRARDLAVAIDGHSGLELRNRSKRGRRKDDGK